jgi:hypothetical protein
VTVHPKTDLASLTLWSLTVEPSGRVTAKPTEGFEHSSVSGDLLKIGTVGVFYGYPGDPQRGVATVEFEILR